MKEFIGLIQEKIEKAFEECGYDVLYGQVVFSNRPDLCEYQCDGALAAAKKYKKAPFLIANEVVEKCKDDKCFKEIVVAKPGFINITVSEKFLTDYCNQLNIEEKFGCKIEQNKTVVIDYGGPNIAKPLHVGHLRPAIIGESVKRIYRFFGNNTIGDVHLGDWGLQMGLVIKELQVRHPDWVYFDENYTGVYPEQALFTVTDLEEIYPYASAKAKFSPNSSDEEKERAIQYKKDAQQITGYIQSFKKGYYDLWKKISEISIIDLKKNYANLNVSFELWLGESDSEKYVEDMVNNMKKLGIIYESEGAMVVDVTEPQDKIKVNPCMVLKTGGVSCYQTTDLATIMQRELDFKPSEIIYVVDKRQDMHFLQVFRCARKAKIVPQETKLTYLGFGTINSKSGKPFKTRDGGVMRLEALIRNINEIIFNKMTGTRSITEEEARHTAKVVGLAALKYADLSNQIAKDYIFDVDKFTSLEGNTGPYILYTLVRIKSILKKYFEKNDLKLEQMKILEPENEIDKKLLLIISKVNQVLRESYEEKAPSKICAYLYELANLFNSYYQKVRILQEQNTDKLISNITMLILIEKIFLVGADLLGIDTIDKM